MNAAKLKPVTYDPLPIPTRLVNPTEFLHQSHNILELVESKLEEWESLSDNAVLTERCS